MVNFIFSAYFGGSFRNHSNGKSQTNLRLLHFVYFSNKLTRTICRKAIFIYKPHRGGGGSPLKTRSSLSDTHRRCKYLLEQTGYTVSQSLVLCLRDAFDLTVRKTINPVPSQRRYYRLKQLELGFVLQMEWCITHHIS